MSWSESQSYADVTITALFDSFIVGETPTASAYLTTTIGPQATAADQIAQAEFTVPMHLPVCDQFSCGAVVTLFSGLTLGPGDYFLTLGPPTGNGTVGWFPAINPTVIEDAGVTLGPCFEASTSAPYAPASGLMPAGGECGPSDVMSFAVTGTPATPLPEPATLAMIGFGAVFLLISRRAKLRTRQR
jgi:hypothetical protein